MGNQIQTFQGRWQHLFSPSSQGPRIKAKAKEEGDQYADHPPTPSSSWPWFGEKTQKQGIQGKAVVEGCPQCCGTKRGVGEASPWGTT